MRDNDQMSMMRGLVGVRVVGETLNDAVQEVHGMFDRHVGDLERMYGCIPNSTSTTSSVWTIKQLRFRDRNAVVVHVGTAFVTYEPKPIPPGPIDGPGPFPNPNPPGPAPAPNPPTPGPRPPIYEPRVGSESWAYLTADPDSVDFNNTNWLTKIPVKVTKTWNHNCKFSGPCYVRLLWAVNKTWIHVADSGAGNVTKKELSNNQYMTMGRWDDTDPYYFTLWIDSSTVPVGGATGVLRIRAMDSNGVALRNPDGQEIEATVDIGVAVTNIQISSPSPAQLTYDVDYGGALVSHSLYIRRILGTANLWWKAWVIDDTGWPSDATRELYYGGVKVNEGVMQGPISDDAEHEMELRITPGSLNAGATYTARVRVRGYLSAVATEATNTEYLDVAVNVTSGSGVLQAAYYTPSSPFTTPLNLVSWGYGYVHPPDHPKSYGYEQDVMLVADVVLGKVVMVTLTAQPPPPSYAHVVCHLLELSSGEHIRYLNIPFSTVSFPAVLYLHMYCSSLNYWNGIHNLTFTLYVYSDPAGTILESSSSLQVVWEKKDWR